VTDPARRPAIDPDPGVLVAVDALAVAVVSVAIGLAADRLRLMTLLVPTVLALRTAAAIALDRRADASPRAEIAFFALCTLLGAFNDWNSVCRKHIYDYTVPHEFAFSTIPVWMLLFWGMVLRFVQRLARWRALRPDLAPNDRIGVGRLTIASPAAKVAAELLLVAVTRAFIYRFYLDPLRSWLPFLVALAIWIALFHPTRHDAKLAALFLMGGPIVEVLYIQVGHLHRYHLGWIGGVPLWIVAWWVLVVLIWKDLALRIERALRRAG
jgi:hypothetical protein